MTNATVNNPMVSGIGLKYELNVEYVFPGKFNLYHPLFPNSVWGVVTEINDNPGGVRATFEPTISGYKYHNIFFPNWEIARQQLNIHANRNLR